MKKLFLNVLLALISFNAMSQDKPSYAIFNQKGDKSNYELILKDALTADIVFFGEYHNSAICHWLELELTKDIYNQKKDSLILGAEMFESDDQLKVSEYLKGIMKEKNFKEEAKLWKNYSTDYAPLLNFAKEKKLKFIATNVPRRYASLVYSKGFEALESLEPDAKKYLPPLPLKYDGSLKCYKDMSKKKGLAGIIGKKSKNDNFPKAQAIKDATMAYFILNNYTKGKTFIHYNGSYHSDNFEGIVWYLKQEKPDLKIVTISVNEQDKIDKLSKDAINKASYIICIPEDFTKTY